VSGYLTAVDAHVGSLLRGRADHAEHIPGLGTDEIVVLIRIVAEATGVPLLACEALHLDVPLIVLTSKGLLRLWYHFEWFHRCFTAVTLWRLHRHK
jgi:hypothetical protein